jgi:heat shock protein HslJ
MMFKRLFCLLVCILFIVLIAGCLTPLSPARAPPSYSWSLVSYNAGGKLVKTDPNTTAILKFGPHGLINGSIGCNEYYGRYQSNGEIIAVIELGSTDIFCNASERTREFEQRYLFLLNNTTRYSYSQDTLTLSYYDEKKLLVFERQPF